MDTLTVNPALAVTLPPSCLSQPRSSAANWIGPEYLAPGYSGVRLLLLGERPLGGLPLEQESLGASPPHTKATVRRRFWRNVARLAQGGGRELDSELLWSKVAYATYLRTGLSLGKRVPSPEMWTEGQREFVSLMEQLAPDCVLVLGYRLYVHLAELGTAGPEPETRSYRHAQGTALVARVMNPLAPGFIWQKEALRVKRAVTLTKLAMMA